MSEGSASQRAFLLMQTNRPKLAEKELRRALAEHPDDARAHAYLALCLSQQKRHDEALAEANLAIRCAPDKAYGHYVRGRVLVFMKDLDEAEVSATEATRLEPNNAVFWSLRAAVAHDRGRWRKAAEWAEVGLRNDPNHVGCLRVRSLAMSMLGQKQEARQSAAAALAIDPANTTSHAVQGWTYLRQNDPKAALEHFREALRIEPANEYARRGLVKALKARHLVYRFVLQYLIWATRWTWSVRLGLIFSAYVVFRVAMGMPEPNPILSAVATAMAIGFIGFWLLGTLADPLFNLTLVLNKHGWNALTPFARAGTLIWAGLLVTTVATGVLAWQLGVTALLAVAVFSGAMLLSTTLALRLPPAQAKKLIVAPIPLALLVAWMVILSGGWSSIPWRSIGDGVALGCGVAGFTIALYRHNRRRERRAQPPDASADEHAVKVE